MSAKLLLRRYFVDKYHQDAAPSVMDCCAGDSTIWNILRKEYNIGNYWGLDKKHIRGRHRIDSARVLEIPGWSADIIDIDTYGSPWRHYFAMLSNLQGPVTVFLTVGHVSIGGGRACRETLKSIGCTFRTLECPSSLEVFAEKIALSYCLTKTYDYDILIREAQEAVVPGNARYIGVRLDKEARHGGIGNKGMGRE